MVMYASLDGTAGLQHVGFVAGHGGRSAASRDLNLTSGRPGAIEGALRDFILL
jgi:hypothetical protein